MMEGHFAALSSLYDNYCTLNCINMSSISLYSQMKMLLYNMNYIIVNRELFELGGWETKYQLFNMYFLIQDISLNNTFRSIKFKTHIHNVDKEGTMSQILDLGLSFCFIKCRKFCLKKIFKSTRFFA